jgi:hypothetical protein|tara:strand:+ start:183 stop:500 length:318 start_codon:yes stop_codon:yes gene_type:complete
MKKKRKRADHYVKRFDGKRIPLYFETISKTLSAEGLCYDPLHKDRKILVDKRLGKRRKLNVIIEEITHAFFFDEPEYKVRKFSAELGKIIYGRFVKKNAIENNED